MYHDDTVRSLPTFPQPGRHYEKGGRRGRYPRGSSRHFPARHKLFDTRCFLGSGVWRAEPDQTPEPWMATNV